MLVADLCANLETLALLRCSDGLRSPRLIQGFVGFRAIVASAAPAPRTIVLVGQQRRQVQVAVEAHLLEEIDATDRRFETWQTELRQQTLQVARKLPEERHHVLRLAAELRAKLRLLRRNAGRAGVQVALPRHIA